MTYQTPQALRAALGARGDPDLAGGWGWTPRRCVTDSGFFLPCSSGSSASTAVIVASRSARADSGRARWA
jgi:hypothetical protein